MTIRSSATPTSRALALYALRGLAKSLSLETRLLALGGFLVFFAVFMLNGGDMLPALFASTTWHP